MGLPVKDNSSNYEKIPTEAGNHLAICYSVIDLGTHINDYMGVLSPVRKVKIGWELPNLKKKYTPKDSDEEREYIEAVYKDYTLSLNEKANLRKDLEGWRGVAFKQEELEDGFDIEKLIGVPCLVNVIHKVSKTGNTYAFVAGISPVIKGMDVPELSRSTQFLSFEEGSFDENLYNSLPEWLQNKIAESNEYKRMNTEEVVVSETTYKKTTEATDDDVPF